MPDVKTLMDDLNRAEAAIKDGDVDMCKFHLLAASSAAREIERELDEMDGKLDNLARRLGAATETANRALISEPPSSF